MSDDIFDAFFADDSTASDVPQILASLHIRGSTLDPDFVTQHLGVAPSFSARRGEPLPAPEGEPADTGTWSYRLDVPADTELGDAVDMLLARFPSDSTLWSELTEAYTIDITCSLLLRAEHQRTVLDAAVLERLGRLGLSLSFEFHAP